MSNMSKIDQIHLRVVMLYMSKMSKMGKEHTHTFLYRVCDMLKMSDIILIFFECNSIYVEDVKDRSNTPKGCNACNAMYVKDVEDWKKTYIHIFAHNFLNI